MVLQRQPGQRGGGLQSLAGEQHRVQAEQLALECGADLHVLTLLNAPAGPFGALFFGSFLSFFYQAVSLLNLDAH